MMHSFRWARTQACVRLGFLAFLALPSAAACGGQSFVDSGGTAGGGNAGQGGAGGGGGAGGSGTAGNTSVGGSGGSMMTGGSTGSGGSGGGKNGAEGSYDLTFKGVVVTTRLGAPMSSSPSEGKNARVDLRRAGATYEAVVTPRWGTPSAYVATTSASELKLTGAATLAGGTFGFTTDKWTELRLGLDAAGSLSGGVNGSGEETIIVGDVIDMATLTTGGSVVRDATLPEVRSEVSSPILPAGQMLPWEGLGVGVAEGVAANAFKAGLSVGRDNPDPAAPMPMTEWVTGPTDATSWAGAVTAVGKTKSWDELGGIPMQVRVPSAAVTDRAAHAMATNYASGFTFIDIKLAASGYPLDAPPTPVPAQWGEVVFHGMTGADPMCESGVCAVFGPFDNGWCNVGRRGLAGRLFTPPSTPGGPPVPRASVRVRYRVLAAAGLNGTPTSGPAPFSIDVVALGGDPRTTEVKLPTLRDLGAAAGEFRYVSDFLDAIAPAPDGALPSELGFAVYAGTRNTISCGPGGLLPPPTKTQVIIEKITIEPG